MNVGDFARRADEIKGAFNSPQSREPSASSWLQIVSVLLEEPNAAAEELKERNDELRLKRYLMMRETDRFRELFDLTPQACLVTNEMGVIIDANRAAGDVLNVAQSSLHGKPLVAFIDQDDHAIFQHLLDDSAMDEILHIVELRVSPHDRLDFDAEVAVRASNDQQGTDTVLRWAVRDLTRSDRHLKQERALNSTLLSRIDAQAGELHSLLESQQGALDHGLQMADEIVRARERLNTVVSTSEALSSSMDAMESMGVLLSAVVPAISEWGVVALSDETGTLTEVAVSHQREDVDLNLRNVINADDFMAGSLLCCADAVIETGMPQFIVGGSNAAEKAVIPEAFTSGSDVRSTDCSVMSVPLRSRGSTIGVLEMGRSHLRPSFNSDDLAFALELTGPSSLALDNAQLFERSKAATAARDNFLSIAAHELRTPITVMRGYAQILSRRFSGDRAIDANRVIRMTREIEKQSDRLAALVDQLVDVSRAESGRLDLHPTTVNVTTIVQSQVDIAQLTTESHSLVAQIAPGQWASVDVSRFEQVVSNLLDNAIKFSIGGGVIDVTLERLGDTRLALKVIDRGIGVKPSHRAHIFDRFYQAHDRAGIRGLGLGLFISREIMRLHGGDLRAEFPATGETVFVADFPLAASPTSA